MSGLDTVAWLVTLPFTFLFGTFLAEVGLGLKSPPDGASAPERDQTQAVILMPAHNEEKGITRTIAALAPILTDRTRLIVVADNCSDDTARIARAAGAQVIERFDAGARGKGYALAFGRDHMMSDPPDVVIVLDADCDIDPASTAILADEAERHSVPIQANYRMHPELAASPMVQISNFAFLVKNSIRQRGMARLGAPALLNGTGMAFPWPIFANAPLASANIVEDLALGIDLSLRNHPPRFCNAASVWSSAAGHRDTLGQRTRWEHGFVATARSHGLRLLRRALARADPGLAWLGLHLLVPPLALLFLLGAGALAITAALIWFGATVYSAALLGGLMVASAIAVLAAWARYGRDTLAPATLLRLPLYILWKIPIYLRLIRRPETEWIRTSRPDAEGQ